MVASAYPDIITVTNTNDSGPGSLRQALADANDRDTITFAVTGTIGLTSGELLVDNAITISGPGAETLAVNGNSAGGIFPDPRTDLTIANSTLSDNGGGSVVNYYTGFISNSTLNESSSSGNDVHNEGFVAINNTVLKVDLAGHSIVNVVGVGNVKSLGCNLSSDDGGGYLTGPGDQINTDPMLGPLQDNGGPTFTHALLPGSPAINAGDPNFVSPPDYDQRGPGYIRVRKGRIDIGSFEVQTEPTPTPRPLQHRDCAPLRHLAQRCGERHRDQPGTPWPPTPSKRLRSWIGEGR
jgi:hypothetical protein